MANFRTHAVVGVVASGMLSTLTMAANVVAPHDLVALAMAGAIGAILPDIDLENSRASQAMFAGLGLFFAFCLLFNLSWQYSIAEMWIVWVGTFLFFRFCLHSIFHKYAKHRGVFHSVLAGCFFAASTAAVFHHVLHADPTLAWLAGVFMFIGYIVHLLLDELYSVDFEGNRVKRSFGTALKLVDLRTPTGTLAMVAGTVLAVLSAPSFEPFMMVFGSDAIWISLADRMLPDGSWFGFIADMTAIASPLDVPLDHQ